MTSESAAPDAASGQGPLAGVRVLDLTSVVMGPLATQILGDLGADVITVESRDGDINRTMSRGPVRGLSGVSLNLLRNKRNATIDISHPDGRAALLRIASGCDVFVTNLRPRSLRRAGLDYADVAAVQPVGHLLPGERLSLGFRRSGRPGVRRRDPGRQRRARPDAPGRAAARPGADAARRQGLRAGHRLRRHRGAVPPGANRAGTARRGADDRRDARVHPGGARRLGDQPPAARPGRIPQDPHPAARGGGHQGRLDRAAAASRRAVERAGRRRRASTTWSATRG